MEIGGILFIAFIFFVIYAVQYLCHRASDISDISREGGIRTKYNKTFSYIYNLPVTRIVNESKSRVEFQRKNLRFRQTFILSYGGIGLTIKCKTIYNDDTKWDNWKTEEWTVLKGHHEIDTLKRIQSFLDCLP